MDQLCIMILIWIQLDALKVCHVPNLGWLFIYQFINLSIYQFINLSIYQFINLSIYQFINLSSTRNSPYYVKTFLQIFSALGVEFQDVKISSKSMLLSKAQFSSSYMNAVLNISIHF
jgi:hypothetical protein